LGDYEMSTELETHVVVKGVIVFKEKFLIVKRSHEDEIAPGTWEFPGGKIEFEEEIEPALIREVMEETGLEITVDRILYATSFFTKPTRKVFLLTYLCGILSNEVQISEEHSDYMWVKEEEVNQFLPSHILADFDKVPFLTER
jgi:8-oxo-dGTP diphosphatase